MTIKPTLPSTAVGRRRLLKGAALLEADANNKSGIKFDFSQTGKVTDPEKPLSCGTAGCALGLFGVSRAFEKQGLSYAIGGSGRIRLTFKGCGDTFRSAEQFFQISEMEAEFLFAEIEGLPNSLTGAKTERAVAKRIRQFVAGKAAP